VPSPDDERAGYRALLKNGNFLRFFLAQAVSSLGDWIGVIAIAVLAQTVFDSTAAVGVVMIARVLPGFVVGPLGGVLADRWDRKRTMVLADALRAAIVFSLPFIPNLAYFVVASAALESLTLLWGPAKDASLPHFVPRAQLIHANSMSLIAVYGPWPVASILFASLSAIGGFLAANVEVLRGLSDSPEALALWVDSLTFLFSAVMISTLSITSSRTRARSFDLEEVRRDLVEGLLFVRDHDQVRPWMLGIAITFTAAGGVFSLGPEFVKEILEESSSAFGLVMGFFGTGMIIGLLASGVLAKRIKKDVLFSSTIMLLGAGLIALAGTSSLNFALPIAGALGFFGGVGYSIGYALMQATTEEELRGRTFGAAYTLIRLGTLVGLGIFPLIAGAIGENHVVDLPGDATLALPGSRVTLWLAGLLVIGGGVLSLTAVRARRISAVPSPSKRSALFIAFEGGEGAGKSTQMAALVKWLEARGEDVVTTREPGGTAIGSRLREVLLDPVSSEMDPRTEALLYAADRAQHAAEVIRPALAEEKIVVSDRFVDSSLAYQGLARGLGLQQIYDISAWATNGLMPDLVFYLDLDSAAGLARVGEERDRLEREDDDFHARVSEAYLELTQKFPERFVVLDARRGQAEIHAEVVEEFEERTQGRAPRTRKFQPPPGPVPR
jgi:dTMP kinase